MKPIARFAGIAVLALGSIFSSLAGAAPISVVFDDTNNASTPVFGPGCCQVGNEIQLGGSARAITQLSWMIYTQNSDIDAEFVTRIFANDGVNGAPGTLLWESGTLNLSLSASDTFIDVMVPSVRVPDVITVTSEILSYAPVVLGRIQGEAPSVGSVNATWMESAPGTWVQQSFAPWALRVTAGPVLHAVPEAPLLLLLLVAGIAGRRFCAFPRSA